MNNPTPYNDRFFKHRALWRADYDAISKWLAINIEGESFGDIGCGNGYMIASLDSLDKTVWGVDASEKYVDKKVRKHVKKADLTQAQTFDKSDVVLCFDVADRINKKFVDTLMKNIVSTSADTIVFTASKPGKAGVHHLNLEPKDYWLNRFSKYRYYLDGILTQKFKNDLAKKIKNPVWYLEDIMILQKCDTQRMARAYAMAGKVAEELSSEVDELKVENIKLKDELWATSQKLNSILGSARWKASSKLARLIKR